MVIPTVIEIFWLRCAGREAFDGVESLNTLIHSRYVVIVFNLIPNVPFRCKFESKPLPTFSWYIDDEKLTDSTEYPTELSEDKMSQTLNYGKPREGHSNKTLKCVVDFNKYRLKDTFEESLVFDFPENVVLVPKKLDTEVCNGLICRKFLCRFY